MKSNVPSLKTKAITTLKFYFYNNEALFALFFLTIIFNILIKNKSYFNSPQLGQTNLSYDWKFYTVLLLLLLLSSILMIYILTRLKKQSVRIIYAVILATASFFLISDIISYSLNTYSTQKYSPFLFWFGLLLSFLIIYSSIIYAKGKMNIYARNWLVLFSAFSLSRTVSLFFNVETIILASLILAVYDAFSVFLGPLRKVLGKPKKISNSKITVSYSKTHLDHYLNKICEKGIPVYLTKTTILIGIGDLLFFSLLLYKALITWGIYAEIIILTILIIGHTITIKIVKKISPFPGLPIPVTLVILTYAIFIKIPPNFKA